MTASFSRAREAAPPDLFARMNALAADLGAVNLGHGFSDDAPLDVLVDAATRAMRSGDNQYSPSEGLVELREALARRSERRGVPYDPRYEITVTTGCAEALVAGLMAMAPPGSEVVAMEPFYDLYPDIAAVAGVRLVTAPIPGLAKGVDLEEPLLAELRKAITPATRCLLLNSPHNPTGLTLSRKALEEIARLAVERDLLVLCDDVYDEFVYERPHESIAAIDGMRERTIVCSSATKTLSVSGWRVGWACGPARLTSRLRNAHRSLTFCAPTPLQAGVAAALDWADGCGFFAQRRLAYARRRDLLVDGLRAAGLDAASPPAGYFVVTDVRRWSGGADVSEFAVRLAHEAGVVAIPLTTSVSTAGVGDHLLRFAFCKSEKAIAEASLRLRQYALEGGLLDRSG